MRRVFIVTAMLFAIGFVASAQIQEFDVDLNAPDGIRLKGTYYSPGKPGPGILLLHQCNSDRRSWDTLADDLVGSGFHVFTVDYRGYGESEGERLTDRDQRRAVREQTWPGDVDAAYAFLLAQAEVDKNRIAAGGASCGVTQSSALAERNSEIKALVLLSGMASDQARAHIRQTSGLAVFGAASEDDGNSAKGIREAVEASENPHSTLRMYESAGHGVPMFASEPELEPMIVEWLKAQLSP